jgi:NADH:ubiquinone oxidoreductase subunit 5 (subunit L)/multisubunit Na+/H+ antiporter MnhA subunit
LSTVGGFIGVPYAMSSLFSDRDINIIEHTLEPVVAHVPAEKHSSGSSTEPTLLSPPPQETDSASPIHALPETAEAGAAAHAVHDPEEIAQERIMASVSVLIALAGIGIGWTIFRKRPLLQLPSILERKYYVDEIYDASIIRPIEVGSREGLWKIFDIGVIDGFLHSIGEAVVEAGRLGRYLQAGFVRGYAAIILTGALIIIGLFVYYSIPLR